MGAGKTSLGKTLAKQTGYPFFDTDTHIKVQTGQSIPEIFSTKGEAAFRKMEEECFHTLTSNAQWISTGGGFPCFNDLMVKMKQLGTVVYLKMTPEEKKLSIDSRMSREAFQRAMAVGSLRWTCVMVFRWSAGSAKCQAVK